MSMFAVIELLPRLQSLQPSSRVAVQAQPQWWWRRQPSTTTVANIPTVVATTTRMVSSIAASAQTTTPTSVPIASLSQPQTTEPTSTGMSMANHRTPSLRLSLCFAYNSLVS
ncbi:unnamed protein product [Hydatigera taeniaeformis]|uniref:Secreted protein n=1 Tax=Hydatigena taeniaeformis TaxID=6205 RepID=A0A0R3WY33_HYDTA|nr:unnamed protein product [Hydatigera taeniaeformis]